MDRVGCIVLSFEEAGDLSGLLPWKQVDARALHAELNALQKTPGFVYLSTCNRVEIIYTLEESGEHTNFALDIMERLPRLRPGLRPAFYQGASAFRHLLRLAAGLESMVLGETEIRAQLKEAFENAVALDTRLRLLFQRVFRESRLIRSRIPLNHLPLSVATLATRKLIERAWGGGTAAGELVAIIGSGPMSQQSARYLAKAGCRIALINRTPEKVEDLARSLSAPVYSFDDFLADPACVGPIAALVTATSRPDAFLTPALVQRLLAARTRLVPAGGAAGAAEPVRPLALIDMAVPRDVAPECGELPGALLIDMESMREELAENRERRRIAAGEADRLIDDLLYRLEAQLIAGLSAPVMGELQREVHDKSRRHLSDLLDGRLKHLSNRDRRMLYTWAIQANRDLNRLHRRGLESVLRYYHQAADRNAGPAEADGDVLRTRDGGPGESLN